MPLISPVPRDWSQEWATSIRKALLPTVLATDAEDGFTLIPTMAGAPTGVPQMPAGSAAVVYDTTNLKLWVFDPNTASWRFETLT